MVLVTRISKKRLKIAYFDYICYAANDTFAAFTENVIQKEA